MKYAELDARAQARAFDKWQEDEPRDEWWDSTYDDAVTVGALMGIDISTTSIPRLSGAFGQKVDISFSGFWSQGDGACWSGYLRPDNMAGAVEKMKGHASTDETLHELAARAESIHAQVAAVQVAQRLMDEELADYPNCELGMWIKVDGQERSFSQRVDDDEIPPGIHHDCAMLADDFASWLYDQLEDEHDYLTNKDAFIGWVNDNEPEYDEFGNPE